MSDPASTTEHDGEPTPEQAHEIALTLTCPRCGNGPRIPCQGYHGRFMRGLHAERLSAAVGGPEKENRHNLWRREWGQRRADPTMRVHYVKEDEAA